MSKIILAIIAAVIPAAAYAGPVIVARPVIMPSRPVIVSRPVVTPRVTPAARPAYQPAYAPVVHQIILPATSRRCDDRERTRTRQDDCRR